MIRYEFYGENDILELTTESLHYFIDLHEEPELDEDNGETKLTAYVDRDEVNDLFGSHGILERSPFQEGN